MHENINYKIHDWLPTKPRLQFIVKKGFCLIRIDVLQYGDFFYLGAGKVPAPLITKIEEPIIIL